MCGIRSCLALLQWTTDEKATKYDGDASEAPRPMKKEGVKWDRVDVEKQAARAKEQREGKR